MNGIKVTVGIPAYNSENHIGTCLDSILNQTMDQNDVEIMVVDDGSTDGTAAVLDRYAASYPNMKVMHQVNTGGPGGPRNTIIEAAQGEFLFFVDADDYLGKEALERMYTMGKENGTDVVIGRLVGVNGRGVPTSMFKSNQPKTNVFQSLALETIGPTKMFRRSFLQEKRGEAK